MSWVLAFQEGGMFPVEELTQQQSNQRGWRRYSHLITSQPEFRKMWLGQSTNYLGDSFYDIALMWYVYSVTGSATQSGLVMVFIFLPSILFGIWFGPLIDRMNRKPWLVLTSILQASAILAFGVLAGTHHFMLWAVYLISFLLATGEVAMGPAFSSTIPDLVPSELLITANALLQTTRQLFRLLGSIFGGIVIAVIGMSSAFFIDTASFVAAAFFFAMTSMPPLAQTRTSSDAHPTTVWADFCMGVRWLITRKNLLTILLVATISNIGLAPSNVVPAMYLKRALHAGPSALGVFDSAIGLGILLGAAWLGSRTVQRIGIWFTASVVVQGASLAIVSTAPALWVSVLGNFLLGISAATAAVPLSTMFQSLVPGDMRGRIGSITNATSTVSVPVTYGLVGVLADHIGARWTYGWGAICLVLVGFVALAVKSVRRTGLTTLNANTDNVAADGFN